MNVYEKFFSANLQAFERANFKYKRKLFNKSIGVILISRFVII